MQTLCRKNRRHGDSWVVLTLDNLLAHVAEDVKKLFTDDHDLLIYFPSQTTESAQPIDVGHGMSVRCCTGNIINR